MSSELADKLLTAASAEEFWREQGSRVGWQTFSELKSEIDRLTGHDLNAARTLSERLADLAQLTGNPVSQAFAEASRARILHHEGRHSEANTLYATAVHALRRARLSTEAAMLQKQQVAALKYLGRFSEALKTARAARRTLAKVSPIQLAQLETNVGNVYYQLDRYKEALAHYDRAREIFSTTGDEAMRATVDFGRANILTELDRPDEALVLLESAAAAYDKAGQASHAAQSRFHIAYIQFLKGNYNVALAAYYEAREQLTGLGNRQLAAWCDLEIAEILLALNAFEDALENAGAARQHFRELGMSYESAKAALTQALAAIGLRRLDTAESHLLEAREVFAQKKNKTFTALADTYLAELALHRQSAEALTETARRAAAAMRTFTKQKLATRAAYAQLLAARAAYHAGKFAKSARLIDAALQTVENLHAPSVTFKGHHLKGQIERERRRPALDYFRRAVSEIERMRAGVATDEFKTTFLRDKIEAYEDAIKACLDEMHEAADQEDAGQEAASRLLIEEAFRLVELAKSRSLADLIAGYAGDLTYRRQLPAEAEAQLAKLIEDLNWYSSHAGLEDDKGDQRRADVAERYRREVARCEKQIAQLFRRVQSESLRAAELPASSQTSASSLRPTVNPAMNSAISTTSTTVSINELRTTLAADETAIEYFVMGDEISAFVASRSGVHIARHLASRSEVEKTLAALRFQIEKFNYGPAYVDSHFGQLKRATDGHLTRLHQALFAPLRERLTGEKIIIIPHGALHYLPFHALREESQYLVEGFEISYAPSAAVLRLCRERSRENQSVERGQQNSPGAAISHQQAAIEMVALGVVENSTPSIKDEIRALGALFPDCVKLTGGAATQENLHQFAPRARFLHLASHGYFRQDNPMFSFLKLADANLNFYNLLDLRLNAELVTLSACHTGVNAIFPGDELHGLMRGFLYAGAPSMVVSLWAVNDQSTTELMSEMYTHIQAGESKRAALDKPNSPSKIDTGIHITGRLSS